MKTLKGSSDKMADGRILYLGCFIKPKKLSRKLKQLERTPLEKAIKNPHITFEYKPEKIDFSLFGKKVKITAVGYGNNGKNEGLLVTLSTEDKLLSKMIKKIEKPHITLSVSADGKPVNTKDLEFSPIEPINLTGIYGCYTTNDEVVISLR